jgi:hypothetical protein
MGRGREPRDTRQALPLRCRRRQPLRYRRSRTVALRPVTKLSHREPLPRATTFQNPCRVLPDIRCRDATAGFVVILGHGATSSDSPGRDGARHGAAVGSMRRLKSLRGLASLDRTAVSACRGPCSGDPPAGRRGTAPCESPREPALPEALLLGSRGSRPDRLPSERAEPAVALGSLLPKATSA